MTRAADYNRRIQILRAVKSENAFGEAVATTWAAIGPPLPAKVEFGNGNERRAAAALGAVQPAVFRVRRSAFAQSVTPRDRISLGGQVFGISAVIDHGALGAVEFTASAESI